MTARKLAEGVYCLLGSGGGDGGRSLSQTLSGWRVAANRAMLLRDAGSLQAHWLDGRRPDPVAGSA